MPPNSNGRKPVSRNYQQLYDPTVDEPPSVSAGSSSITGGYLSLPEPQPYNNQYKNDRFSYAEPSRPDSVGAYRVPSSTHLMPPVPEHEESARTSSESYARPETVPWDANAVSQAAFNPEDSLINKNSLAPRRTRRGSSISNSFRKYWDPESQEHGQVGRASSIRQLFGMQRENTINEYADDEYMEQQIPISGDEYQLNTWVAPQEANREAENPGEYTYEHDLSQNYGDGTFPGEELDPWQQHLDPQDGYTGGYNEGYTDGYPDEYIEEYGEKDGEEEEGGGNDAKSTQVVELFRGNLVLDCPVSPLLLEKYPDHRPVREFTHMRYTAATCDPSSFTDDQYTLRQMCYSQPRQTELFICVTIYNEDDILLGRTLQGVFNNIRHLCHRDRSQTWGPDAWKKVVVCVVADGRDKLNPRAKALMAALGAYQEGFAKNMVNNRAVEGHIYEYTSMVRISKVSNNEGVKLTTEKATPVQLMFCMKEKNQKKINSHRWFFQAFGEILKPNVCVLLDAGTRPGNHSIYHLWKTFARDSRVAGACGEIAAMLGTGGNKLVNPLVAAQNFEYKMSNILDKPSESVFGFITVLPGAFSAYRYEALQNNPNGSGPLEKYFKGEKLEGKGGVFQANMYLAEDRILCWELVSKRNANWLLRYVKAAKAHTDVPERLSELILQRRRWLNGSFFAQVYSLAHFWAIWGSGHSIGRKLSLHIQFLYQLISLTFSWFSLANFFLVFHILAAAIGDPSAKFAPGRILGVVLTWVYAACIMVVFILSFGNRPQGTKRVYDMIVVFFSLMMAYMVFATIYITVKAVQYAICANGGVFQAKLLWTNSTFRDLIISLMATYALYLISSLLFLDPWHVLTSLFQYTILSPSYINVLNVYAFCNTHDISWGTKGDTQQKLDLGVVKADEEGKLELELPTSTELVDKYYLDEVNVLSTPPEPDVAPPPSDADKQRDYYALFRSTVVVVWVLMNLALVGVVLNVGGFQTLIGDADGANSSTSSSSTNSGTTSNSGSANSNSASSIFKRADSGTCEEISTGGSIVSTIYMAVIFWSVAGLAAYRFLLSIIYLFKWMFRRV